MSSVREISKVIDTYSTTQLTRVHDEMLRGFMQEHQELFRQYGVVPTTYLERSGIATAIASIFFHRDLMDAFLAKLPEGSKKAFLSVIWDGRQHVDFLEQKYKVKLNSSKTGFKHPQETLLPECLLLKIVAKRSIALKGEKPYQNVELDLDPVIRNHARIVTQTPVVAELEAVHELPPGVQIFESAAFFDEFITLRTYLEQNPKNKLNISTIKNIQKQLQLQEFFPDNKQLGSMRTRLQLLFLSACLPPKPLPPQAHQQLKAAFERYKQWYFQNLPTLLTHLKGSKSLLTEEYAVKKIIFETLLDLPFMQWVAAENLVSHIRYRKPELLPFRMYMVRNVLYVEQGPAKKKLYVDDTSYFNLISVPLIKGSFFLYAALGLVHIAYTEPVPNAVSPFEGLAYVRLTPLGSYVCGLNPNYEPPAAEEGAVGFELDEHRLLISVTGTSKLNALMLEKYADKIGESLYKVSYESFLSGCNTRKDIESKISSFGREISSDVSDVWHDFLASLPVRYNTVQLRHDCRVYRLPPHDKTLVGLVARDEVLKSMVQKAEGFNVLVKDVDAPKFKARLRQFGYLFQD